MDTQSMFEELEEVEPGAIWVCRTNLRFLLLPIGARMTVIKSPGGDLFIHSPVGINEKIKQELSHLGRVRFIVSPNCLHHLFISDYIEQYPFAHIYSSPGLEEKRQDIFFYKSLKDEPEKEWSLFLDQLILAGVSSLREVVFFHKQSKTLIVADLVMNFTEKSSPLLKIVLMLFRLLGKPFSPIDMNKLSATDRALVRHSIERILEWDFDRIILSHGEIIPCRGKEILRQIFASLLT